MSGDSTNASLWTDADVYVGQTLTSANPTDAATPFGATWDLVGLLDGDDGFGSSRDVDKNKFFAWGGIVVRESRGKFVLTRTFTALEDNAITRALIWPGSDSTTIVVPRPVPIKLGFELREGNKVKRLITRKHAIVDVAGDIKEAETDLTKYPLSAVIYPDGAGVLFDLQEDDDVTTP